MSDSSWPHGLQPTRLLSPWDSPGQEYWSGLPLPSHLFWFMYKSIPKHLYSITGNLHLLTPLIHFWPHSCFWQPPSIPCICELALCLFCLLICLDSTSLSGICFFFIRLISLSLMLSRSIHVITNGMISFSWTAESILSVYLYLEFSHFSPIRLFCKPMDCSPPGSSVHGIDSPGKNTGVGCHALLRGIVPTQGSNSCLLLWQVDSLSTEPPVKPHPYLSTPPHFLYPCTCYWVLSLFLSWLL